MRNLTIAAAAVAVLVSGPVLAQDASPAPAVTAAPAALSEEEMGAAGEAFGADMEAMQAELEAARTAAGADTAKANADADAIQAAHQAKADAFAETFKTFIDANPGVMPAEAVEQVMAQIKGAPATVRQGVMSAPAGASATPSAN
jgi:hypothetical protein